MRSIKIAALVAFVGAVACAVSLHVNARSIASAKRALRRPRTWLIGVPAMILALTLGVPFAYHQILIGPPPEPLSFADLPVVESADIGRTAPIAPTSTPTPSAVVGTPAAEAPAAAATEPVITDTGIAGSWKVGAGTQAGYGIDDTVFGQTTRVVGRTKKVSGTATVVDTSGTAAHVVVDMASVMCNCVHDSKYRDLLEVEKYPTSTFELTTPVSVSKLPPEGTVVTLPVTGRFTIHGVTRPETFSLEAKQSGPRIAVTGSIPVKLEDYGIERPDAGAFGGIDNASIDLLVVFQRAS